MADEKEMAGVPEGQKQGWGQFLKSIATFSGDLSAMTAPSFILSPTSLTEYPSYWGENPELFAACAQGKDDIERMINVLRWFIGTLKGQYTARNESSGSEKKPLNPVLGELFLGKWSDQDGKGETELIAEQVSHHPPVTAYWLHNAKAGVTLEGHSGQKTAFSGRSINVKQVGHAILRVANSAGAEDLYLITLPTLVIEGLWYGAPYIELSGTSHICSSTGYLSTINYSGKGYFSGKSHTYKATVSPVSQPTSALYTVEGDWSGVSNFRGKSTDGGSSNSIFYDASSKRREVEVRPVEEQGSSESRKLWNKVANGIRSGDYETASREKTRIENEQRQKRRDEQANSTPHQLEHFVYIDDDKEYAKLIAQFKGTPPNQEAYRRKPRVH